jgi:hypothetical protein
MARNRDTTIAMSQPPYPPPGSPPSGPPAGGFGQAPPPPGGYPPPAYGNPHPPAAGIVDALIPTNPLAAVACWVGILSVLICGFGVILGPIALVTGIISLKKGAIIQQSTYGKGASTARSWIGIVTGALGTLISIAFIIMQLVR